MGTTTLAPRDTPASLQLGELMKRSKTQIEKRLPLGMDVDRFLRMAITVAGTLSKPCTPESILLSTLDAAELGLEVQQHLAYVYFVPRYDKASRQHKAHLQVGYRGLLHLAWKAQDGIRPSAEIVHVEDEFDISLGTDRKLTHKPVYHKMVDGKKVSIDRSKEEDWLGVYATIDFKDGSDPIFAYMTAQEVTHIRDRFSESADSNFTPWKTTPEEMYKKTILRRLCKLLPMSTEDSALKRAAVLDEYHEAGVFQQGQLEVESATPKGPAVVQQQPTAEQVTEPEPTPVKEEPPLPAKKISPPVLLYMKDADTMLIRLPNAAALPVTKAVKAKWDENEKWWIAKPDKTNLAVTCGAHGLQLVEVDESWRPILDAQAMGAEAKTEPRGVIVLTWVDMDVAEARGAVHDSDLREQVGKFSVWMEGRQRYSIPAQHVDDFKTICEQLGYELRSDEPPAPKPEQEEQPGPPPVAAVIPPAPKVESKPTQATLPGVELKVVEQVRGPKLSTNKKTYYEVYQGGKWYRAWADPKHPELLETIKDLQGQEAAFIIKPASDPKYQDAIKGFIQIGNIKYEADGITSIIDRSLY